MLQTERWLDSLPPDDPNQPVLAEPLDMLSPLRSPPPSSTFDSEDLAAPDPQFGMSVQIAEIADRSSPAFLTGVDIELAPPEPEPVAAAVTPGSTKLEHRGGTVVIPACIRIDTTPVDEGSNVQVSSPSSLLDAQWTWSLYHAVT